MKPEKSAICNDIASVYDLLLENAHMWHIAA